MPAPRSDSARADPSLCTLLSEHGPWICGIGGAAAGIVLGLRGRSTADLPFWSTALAALVLPASLGCIPAGTIGFVALAVGLIAGAVPALASRRALV